MNQDDSATHTEAALEREKELGLGSAEELQPASCPGMEESPDSQTAAIATAAIEATTSVAKEALRNSSRNLLAWFVLGLLGVGLYFTYALLRPFLNTLVLAAVFAALSSPVYARAQRLFNSRSWLSASMVTLGVTILVIVPMTVLIIGLIPQMRLSAAAITTWLGEGHLDEVFSNYLDPFFNWLGREAPFLDITAQSAKADIVDGAKRVGQEMIGFSANLVGQTLNFVLHFLLFLLTLFFFLKDGSTMLARFKYLIPLREEQVERIIENLRNISRSVLLGGFLVAALQGFVGGIGLAIVGFPALFWGTVMAFCSFVPVVGTGLVWVPAACVLLLTGSWKSAIFLALWCGIVVSSIDGFLRPYLMRDASGVPILFLFLAIFGGVQAFGIFGLLYGPLILTFAVVMLKIYADEYQEQLKSKNTWSRE